VDADAPAQTPLPSEARCGIRPTVAEGDCGSRALGHEADVCSLDRDPNIYGIRTLNSCRAHSP